MNKLVAIAAAVLLIAGCHSATPAPPPGQVSPMSTSTATVQDTGHALSRFTQDIWPAVVAYNGAPDQGSPGYRQYIPIIDHLNAVDYNNLRAAVEHLGTIQRPGGTGEISRDANGLILANAHVTAETADTASILACYTFVATELRLDDQPPAKTPAASEATFELRKTDSWQLHAITDDHMVPGCAAAQS